MASDDLDAPLGLNKKPRRRFFALPFHIPLGLPIAALLVLCLVVFAGWALTQRDPLGGEPVVVISAKHGGPNATAPHDPAAHEGEQVKTAAAPAAAADAAATAPGSTAPANPTPSGPTVTIIDGSTGKRHEVSLPSPEDKRSAAIDQRLLETTRHGPVPRVSLDGKRPSAVYASAAEPVNPSAPKVALIVGGLGMSESATAEAIKNLPGAVTLAFVPYAAGLETTVARARGAGHEVLLQIPMEPFDYPDNDPGPQTLLTSLAPDQNIDRMHWLMSRFQGYVGVANLMGARFTATDTALAPVLREVAKRGLVYFDDGTSPRSLASQIAGANNMPFAKAHVVIDAAPTQAEVERALAQLEAIAREQGVAVGVATALPLSIEHIAQWAKNAEGRGFALVPITAVAAKAKGS
ncbi:MAG: divergent polysaccharide deacetylase family protein [Xanthobacteraceae bacterium]